MSKLVPSNSPRISVITVNRNNAIGLRKTLTSVAEQTASDYEVIVIDAMSTDETHEVVAYFADLITVFEFESARGVYSAMNQGTTKARGDWTIFLNSGDYFFDDKVIEEFTPQYSTDLAYGRAWLEGTKGPAKYNGLENIWVGQPFCHQALFTRTSVLRELPFDSQLTIVADYKFLCQAYLANKKFEDLDSDICWIEPPGISGEQVFKRLLEKYVVSRAAFPEKPVLRNSVKQYLTHYRTVLRHKLRDI